MELIHLKNKKILILGFAREGLSSYKFLRRYFKNEKLWVADNKTLNQFESSYKKILQQDKNLILNLGKKYLNNLAKVDIIIKTPGIKLNSKLIRQLEKRNIIITSNLNIFLANIKGKVIGVTGSKGKGTVATLIFKILQAGKKKVFLVGNIGQPFLNSIKQDSLQTIYVAELSSFHLEKVIGKFAVGVFLSFFPEHLKEHNSVKNYFDAKMNLIRNIKTGGVVVYNKNYKEIDQAIKQFKKNKTNIKFLGIPRQARDKLLPIKTPLLGQHNQLNIQAALTVAKLFKIKKSIILKTIKNFGGLPYRLEPVGKFKGIKFYCDTLGTTPEATSKAVEALQKINLQTLIVGGVSKGGNYNIVAKAIIKSKIRTLIILPNVGMEIGKIIKKNRAQNKPNLVVAKNMKQAVNQAFKLTRPNETVCLSPAGASFDFYKDYAAKGEDFKRLIRGFK